MTSDAKRKANQVYQNKLKTWIVRVKPELFEKLETARGDKSRREWLEEQLLIFNKNHNP